MQPSFLDYCQHLLRRKCDVVIIYLWEIVILFK